MNEYSGNENNNGVENGADTQDINITDNSTFTETPFSGEAYTQNNFVNDAAGAEANDTIVSDSGITEAYDKKKDETPGKSGIRVFVSILCVALAIIIATSAGYLAGKSQNYVQGNGSTAGVSHKPTDTEVYNAEELYMNSAETIVGITVFNGSSKANASGIVFTEDGYIITDDHIYGGIAAPQFIVTMSDGSEYPAEYVAGDTRSDLAVLKINASGLKTAEFGDPSELVVGEKVAAIGFSAGANEKSIFTCGYISSTGIRTKTTSSYSIKMIQTDTAINPGNSGGALLNMYGQVVGVTSAKLAGDAYDGIGYAIPSDTVVKNCKSLIQNGYVSGRGRLGVTYTEIDSAISKVKNVPRGLQIASISEDSGLYDKGLSAGDIITGINGTEITKGDVALDIIERTEPGKAMTFTVYLQTTNTTTTIYAALVEDRGSSSYSETLVNESNSIFGEEDDNSIIK